MLKLFVLLALLVAVAVGQSCLPTEYSNNVWGIPVVLTTPVDVQPGEFCNKNGDSVIQSCCDQATLARYNTFWQNYKRNIDSAISGFKDAAKSADASKLVYGAIPPSIPVDALPQAVKDLLTELVSAYKDFLKNGPNNFGSCLGGLNQYYQGLLCGFCSPNWNNMVTVTETGTTYTATFTLSDTTCDKLGDTCLPFIKSTYPVFAAVKKFLSVINPLENFDNLFPCADGDCPAFACDFLVRGFSIPTGNLNFTDLAQSAATGATAGTARLVANTIAVARNPFNVRNWMQTKQSGSVAQTNTYSSDGYDVYSAGANGGFAAGSNSNNSPASALVPSIVAGLLAAMFAL